MNYLARVARRVHIARPFIVLLLLVGLWLMHGMSGTTEAGCHGAAMPVPMTVSNAMPDVAVAPAPTSSAPTVAASRTMAPSVGTGAAEQMRHGELCQSGQPPTPGRDTLALLALLALAGPLMARDGTRSPFGPRLTRRAGKRAPPGLSGTRLLSAVCVSRT